MSFLIRKSVNIMDICSSSQLFAAYHVLHRLLVPRHSPYALSSLTFLLRINFALRCQSSFINFRCTNVLSQVSSLDFPCTARFYSQLYLPLFVNRFLNPKTIFKVTNLILVYLIIHLYIFQCASWWLLTSYCCVKLRHNLLDILMYYLSNSSSFFVQYSFLIFNFLSF